MNAPPSHALDKFARSVHDQLFGHILPFWTGPALDHEQGGWLAWMSNDLRVDRSQPKGLILNSRLLWTFSAVHRFRPDPLYRQMAERAFDVVMNRFWDEQHGGAFWQLAGQGCVLDDSKKTYGQALSKQRVDYNLYEGWEVTGWPEKVLRRGELLVDGEQWLGRAGSGTFIRRSTGMLI